MSIFPSVQRRMRAICYSLDMFHHLTGWKEMKRQIAKDLISNYNLGDFQRRAHSELLTLWITLYCCTQAGVFRFNVRGNVP